MALHFTRRLNLTLDPSSKAKSFAIDRKASTSSDKLQLLVGYHGNMVAKYSVSTKKEDTAEESKKEPFSLKSTYGQLDCHKQPVRGVTVAANDGIFATNSFDSVKVWSVDLFQYSQKQSLSI